MTPFDPSHSMALVQHEFGEHGGVNMSIEDSSTFTVMHADTMPAIFHGLRGPEEGCYLYGRHFNPTVYALGRQLAAMEGTEAAYATSSGMSAIAATVLQLIREGDHGIVSSTVYGGTFALFHNYLPLRTGLEITFVDVTDPDAIAAAFTPRTRFLYVETLGNPTLVVPDLSRLAALAHHNGAKLLVDNTFCPMVVSPAQHGADIVLHSLTKFVSGASDVIAGAICADQAFIHELMEVTTGGLMLVGPTMDPFVAAKLSLRLPHLGIRMAEHGRRAQIFAERLEKRGERVIYPGLPSHPQYALFDRYVNPGYGKGGIFDLDMGTAERANALLELLQNRDRFGWIAVSLGYFDTLMSCSASSTSSEMPEEDQKKAHISPGLVRLSVGYTGTLEQRWYQLADALDQLETRRAEPMAGRK